MSKRLYITTPRGKQAQIVLRDGKALIYAGYDMSGPELRTLEAARLQAGRDLAGAGRTLARLGYRVSNELPESA